ncbi:unnamed protein product, partial [marine sediment metagenome]
MPISSVTYNAGTIKEYTILKGKLIRPLTTSVAACKVNELS